jgi:hypothetical protein
MAACTRLATLALVAAAACGFPRPADVSDDAPEVYATSEAQPRLAKDHGTGALHGVSAAGSCVV